MATINGTNGGDSLYGTAAADIISGLNGNDTLKGFGGADRLDGGAGIDTVFYGDSTAGVGINLATGRGVGGSAEGDTLISIENVFGSNFNDTLTGTSGANQLHGQDGNDVIKGGGGDDFLDGGNGNDILVSDIFGHSTLDGGAGDDTFKGSGAADVLIGGAGSDTVDFSHKSFVTISLGDPLPYWAGLETPHAQFISIENVTGTAGQDVLVGNGESNVLRGQAGQDNLIGGGGADIMYGGTDSDHYYVDNAGDVVREYVGEGAFDVVWTNTSYTLTAGSEIEQFNVEDHNSTTAINLTGNEFNNIINGNEGDNVINGGAGADTMNGWGGNDTYIVDNPGDTLFENGDIHSTPENESQGFDTVLTSVSFAVGLYSEIEVLQATGTADVYLQGSLDNNRIIGNAGSNIIDGSYGKDTLTGGGGLDVFIWSNVNEIGLFNFDPDIVTDLNRAEGDLLHFTLIDANETVAGNQDFTFIGTAGFTAPGQINWFTNGTDTFIQLNTNADPTVDGIIQVNGVHTVDASWFSL
jgi:Ca2+-binding RTX toxin-like protein